MNDSDYEKMSEFSCGVIELDDFFRYEMKECVQRHYLSAYCAFLNQNDIIKERKVETLKDPQIGFKF